MLKKSTLFTLPIVVWGYLFAQFVSSGSYLISPMRGDGSAGKAPQKASFFLSRIRSNDYFGDPAIAEVATILLACGRNLNYLNKTI